jgi:hypothetical protein
MSLVPSKDQLLMGCAITAVPCPERVPEHGDVMTVREWAECVACGGFIDDDGMGEWSDGTYIRGFDAPWSEALNHRYYDDMLASHLPPISTLETDWIRPSDLVKGVLARPAWATHIVWYNR